MRVQRQAVIVVHGIGEQVPLETLRGLVLGDGPTAAPDRAGIVKGTARVFSESSPAPATCRDRIYSARWLHNTEVLREPDRTKRSGADEITVAQLSRSDVPTDFFEYYWAPRFRDTTPGDLWSWALALLRRRRSDYSSPRITSPDSLVRLAPLVIALAAIGIATAGRFGAIQAWSSAALTVAVLVVAAVVGTHLGLLTAFRTLVVVALAALLSGVVLFGVSRTAATLAFAGSGVFAAALAAVGRFVARTAGDAARYLSHTAGSVEESDLIQTGILTLLDQLHDAREWDGSPTYERIVVIGHSLGAVIAYDAITLLWQRRHAQIALPPAGSNTQAGAAVRVVEQSGRAIDSGGSGIRPPAEPADRDTLVTTFQEAQAGLAAAIRNASPNPDRTASFAQLTSPSQRARWIITDLVTLGSPLAHADAFLAVDATRLRERFEDRSLHQCPPCTQRSLGAKEHPYRSAPPSRAGVPPVTSGRPYTILHQAAAFAVVRWTNRYFRHDVVGGPVAQHFGYGIDDAPLAGTKKWMGWMLLANPHSSYWRFGKHATNRAGTEECRELLHDLLHRAPVYVMTCSRPIDDDLLRELVRLLDPPPDERSDIQVEVRLQVGSRLGRRLPAYLPVSVAPLPTAARDAAIEALLGEPAELVFGDDPLGLIHPPAPLVHPPPLPSRRGQHPQPRATAPLTTTATDKETP